MSWQQIAQGNVLDLANIDQYDDYIPEGDRGLIKLDLRTSVPQSVANELEDLLKQQGVEDAEVTRGSPRLNIYFRKGFPWLAVIAAIILAMAVIAILIISWKLFKEVIPEGAQFPVALILIGIAGLAVVGYVKRKK